MFIVQSTEPIGFEESEEKEVKAMSYTRTLKQLADGLARQFGPDCECDT